MSPTAIERKWQQVCKKRGRRAFAVDDPPPGADDDRHFYMLEMKLPYPSGNGYLHMGHVRNYTRWATSSRTSAGAPVTRCCGRWGFDSSGCLPRTRRDPRGRLPTRDHRAEHRVDPQSDVPHGWAIDWDREVSAHEPSYYRWTQWLFLEFFEHGLAYRKGRPGQLVPGRHGRAVQ